MFYCEFCEISKNIFFHRTPLVAASVIDNIVLVYVFISSLYKALADFL